MICLTLLVIAMAPFADGTTHIHDWRILPTVIAPSVMMILVFAIALDVTMMRIFMTDAEAAKRRRLKFLVRLQLGVFALLILAWAPVMSKVLDIWPFD